MVPKSSFVGTSTGGSRVPVPVTVEMRRRPKGGFTLNVAPRKPSAIGVNVTSSMQRSCRSRVTGQLSRKLKSFVPTNAAVKPSGSDPAVSVNEYDFPPLPTSTVPKSCEGGVSVGGSIFPIPVSEEVSVEPPALTVNVALRVPSATGVKMTSSAQVSFAANFVLQVFASLKSFVAESCACGLRASEPALSVKENGSLLVKISTLPKSCERGLSVGGSDFPMPVSEAVRLGMPTGLTLSVALRSPFATGLKVTSSVQVWCRGNEVVQFPSSSKSFVSPTEALTSSDSEPAVSTNEKGLPVSPTSMVPKSCAGGSSVGGRTVPVPVSEAVRVAPPAVTVNVALSPPSATGVKVTSSVQVAFAANVVSQVFTSLKSFVAESCACGLRASEPAVSVKENGSLLMRISTLPKWWAEGVSVGCSGTSSARKTAVTT